MKYFLLLIICLFSPILLFAQSKGGDNYKELLEYKIKFLAQEMELKSDQQAKFADLYTRMSAEKRKVFEEATRMNRRVRGNDVSSADYDRATEAMAQAKIEEGKIDKKYEAEFKKFLTSKQIYKMKEAEKVFREKMKELRQRRKK